MKIPSPLTTENSSYSKAGVVKLWPKDQIQLSAYFVNTILLEHSHAPLFVLSMPAFHYNHRVE